MKRLLFLAALATGCAEFSAQNAASQNSATQFPTQNVLDLSGEWQFEIDRDGTGEQRALHSKTLNDVIDLPASMPEQLKGDRPTVNTQWTGSLYDSSFYYNPKMAKYRTVDNFKLPFFLTPDRHYIGLAWYRKTVTVPSNWKNQRVVLYLERPHISTILYVNGQKAGKLNSLSTPHQYDITAFAKPGKKLDIALCINNNIDEVGVGQDSHSVTDQTQGNWNGVVGAIELRTTPLSYISMVKVFPNVKEQKATVQVTLMGKTKTGKLSISADLFNVDAPFAPQSYDVKDVKVAYQGESTVMSVELPMKDCQLWDEFSPALYKLTAVLSTKDGDHRAETQFGMRDFKVVGNHFEVNGRQVMLRGTVENCDFPLTGYAPMTEKEWMKVFSVCKKYGLNHMRFHSFCPPEVAFTAADKLGFYLQPEGPSWPNHGVQLGKGELVDTYLMDECIRINDEYGNHASFCMFALGNEPKGNWVWWAGKFVDYWKKADSRHVYTGASVGGSWAWQPKSQYHVKAGARGLDSWKTSQPESVVNFADKIDTVTVPFVSHETGQWCVFPNFDEIDKYTGPNKAKNFEIFRDVLADNGMAGMGRKFMMASGKLQLLCYKAEVERTLRTPGYDGFQLLALNDYSGQGSALVGPLDVFFDEKGYADERDFKEFCAPVVVMAKFPKFVYNGEEKIRADVEVANFSASELKNASVVCTLEDEYGNVVAKQSCYNGNFAVGGCQGAGSFCFGAEVEKATKFIVRVAIEGVASNHYDVWVYPNVEANEGNVLVATEFNDEVKEALKNGGKVLILAGRGVKYGDAIKQRFTPCFWNTSWFKMRPPHTTGIYVEPNHPVFADFPTEYHSNYQWWSLVNNQPVMLLQDFPKEFQPLVQSIDTWFLSRKIGMMFEANVLGGKLIVTTMPIGKEGDDVQKQMYSSVLNYMNSPKFRPAFQIPAERIEDLFTKPTPDVNMFTTDVPDELRKKKVL